MVFMAILDEIFAFKKEEVELKKKTFPLHRFEQDLNSNTRDFKAALRSKKPALIAEIKKASPSQGLFREKFNVKEIAEIYGKYCQAISVVTDERYFQGRNEFILRAKMAANVPILRKDFIVDEYQIFESRYYEADAILLIAALLDNEQINQFTATANSFRMDCVVEVHSEEELHRVLHTNAEIIGINNRDLQSFDVDLNVSKNLVHLIPPEKIKISESGFKGKEEILQVKDLVDALLVGGALIKAENIEEKVKEIIAAMEEKTESVAEKTEEKKIDVINKDNTTIFTPSKENMEKTE